MTVSVLPTRTAGALRPSILVTWLREDGTAEDLTNATLTGVIRSLRTGTTRAIMGTFTVTSAASGIFRWDLHADDVVEGDYRVYINAAFGSSPTPARTFGATWTVEAYPTVTP